MGCKIFEFLKYVGWKFLKNDFWNLSLFESGYLYHFWFWLWLHYIFLDWEICILLVLIILAGYTVNFKIILTVNKHTLSTTMPSASLAVTTLSLSYALQNSADIKILMNDICASIGVTVFVCTWKMQEMLDSFEWEFYYTKIIFKDKTCGHIFFATVHCI